MSPIIDKTLPGILGTTEEPDDPRYRITSATPDIKEFREITEDMAEAQSALLDWSDYFPLAAGTAFEASAFLGAYKGRGAVIKNGNFQLEFELHLPALDIPFAPKIPKIDIIVSLTYVKEGAGNSGTITYNGSVYSDSNLTIDSKGDKRTITPSIHIPGFNLQRFSMSPDGPGEVDLEMKIDGSKYKLDLTAISLAGQQSFAFGDGNPWSVYFPFSKGDAFRIDGPLTYDGKGAVLERTNTVLTFEAHMPEKTFFGIHLPKTDLVVEVEYSKEGAGNKATITVNGTAHPDDNVTIISEGDRRKIIPSIKVPGHSLQQISVAPDGDGEIDLDIKIDGREHDFDLELI